MAVNDSRLTCDAQNLQADQRPKSCRANRVEIIPAQVQQSQRGQTN